MGRGWELDESSQKVQTSSSLNVYNAVCQLHLSKTEEKKALKPFMRHILKKYTLFFG